jgi:acylphosphatase
MVHQRLWGAVGCWVRNEEDASVRVRLEGEQEKIEKMRQWLLSLHEPGGPDVKDVRVEYEAEEKEGKPRRKRGNPNRSASRFEKRERETAPIRA